MFQVGEYVVYGGNGVCCIKDIGTLDMEWIPKDKLYYALCPEMDAQGTVYVPVENPKAVIRKVMSKEEAMELIEGMPEMETITADNDKLREEKYKGCINSCEGKEWIRVIKTIYERKQGRIQQGKRVTSTDERYMKMAEDYLYSELSTVLGIPRQEVPAFIGEKLEGTN